MSDVIGPRDGHKVAITLAVIDDPKEQQLGSDGHGSKIIVIPFDGAAMDRDLEAASTKAPSTLAPTTSAGLSQ